MTTTPLLDALRTAVGRHAIGLRRNAAGGVSALAHPVLKRDMPGPVLDALRPHKAQLYALLDADRLAECFALPPGPPLSPHMVALLLLYDLEIAALAKDERARFDRLMAGERRRGAPPWYCTLAAVEQVIREREQTPNDHEHPTRTGTESWS